MSSLAFARCLYSLDCREEGSSRKLSARCGAHPDQEKGAERPFFPTCEKTNPNALNREAVAKLL